MSQCVIFHRKLFVHLFNLSSIFYIVAATAAAAATAVGYLLFFF